MSAATTTGQAVEFLELLFGDWEPQTGEALALTRFPNRKPVTTFPRSIEAAAAALARAGSEQDWYVGCCIQDAKAAQKANSRGNAETAAVSPGLWLDVDSKDAAAGNQAAALAMLRRLPIQPSAIVDSGHGFHAWFLWHEPHRFDGPEDPERERLHILGERLRVLAERELGGGAKLDRVGDLARILRVPGTANTKATPPLRVALIEHGDARYNPGELEDLLDELAIEVDPRGTTGVQAGTSSADLDFDHRNPTPPPAEKLAALELHPNWLATREHQRLEFKDDQSVYDLATCTLALSHGFSPEEAWFLVHQHREAHGGKAGKLDRGDYAAITLARASESAAITLAKREAREALSEPAAPSKPGVNGESQPNPEPQGILDFAKTDSGAADRFVAFFPDTFRHSPAGGWRAWNGSCWEAEPAGGSAAKKKAANAETRVRSSLKNLAQSATRAAARMKAVDKADEKIRRALIRSCEALENAPRISGAMKLAACHPEVSTPDTAWDARPRLLAVENGTIELRSSGFKLREHRREDMLTACGQTSWKPEARSEIWENFLSDVTGGDASLSHWLQVAAGYSLLGDPRERIAVLLLGPTSTGKSTFLEALRGALGSNVVGSLPFSSLVARDNATEMRPDILAARHARIVTASEVREDTRWDSATLKTLAGNDEITARTLHSGVMHRFRFTGVLWLACNRLPRQDGDSDSLWRRLRVARFDNQFDVEDVGLGKTLRESPECREAILAWAIEGLREYLRNGLPACESVRDATRAAKRESCPVGAWLEARTAPAEEPGGVVFADLYADYRRWGREAGYRALDSQTAFGRQLKALAGDPRRATQAGVKARIYPLRLT